MQIGTGTFMLFVKNLSIRLVPQIYSLNSDYLHGLHFPPLHASSAAASVLIKLRYETSMILQVHKGRAFTDEV